mmetsp:Transcript_6706/g.16638  ORF Transcript_6706/g.16638 Transcript_6706/m.16638 type:complete len:211 (+) Transcript_6706:384-1016(+)
MGSTRKLPPPRSSWLDDTTLKSWMSNGSGTSLTERTVLTSFTMLPSGVSKLDNKASTSPKSRASSGMSSLRRRRGATLLGRGAEVPLTRGVSSALKSNSKASMSRKPRLSSGTSMPSHGSSVTQLTEGAAMELATTFASCANGCLAGSDVPRAERGDATAALPTPVPARSKPQRPATAAKSDPSGAEALPGSSEEGINVTAKGLHALAFE